MAICTQFNTAQLKGLIFKLQCCLGQVSKQYARLRAAGRTDLAKCKEYDIKYLTLAYNALNCIDSLDYTVSITAAYFPVTNSGKQTSFVTSGSHYLQIGQLVSVVGFGYSGLNVTNVPVLAIRSLNEFTVATPDMNYIAGDLGAGTVTAILNNSISCDDIQAILDKVKSICDCDCCPDNGEATFQMSYNPATGMLSASSI